MQGDCKTTYDALKTVNINDEGLRTWVDGQLKAYIDGIVKDTSAIQKTKALYKEKGLETKYPGATYLRYISSEASSIGGILSIKTTDYCLFRPTDADIVKYEMGYKNERDGQVSYNFEGYFPYYYGDGDDEFDVPEAYSYTVKTLNLNLIERKQMQLEDLFKPGADYTDTINRKLTEQIMEQKLDEQEILTRPFTGIDAQYPTFYLENNRYNSNELEFQIIFNEGNPWFNFDAIRDWCAYRYISIYADELAYQMNPLIRDDSILPLVSTMPPESDYIAYSGMATGDKYMPDFGYGEYERENGGSSIRVARMNNEDIKDTINAGIEAFEQKNITRANILKLQGLEGESADNAVISTSATARESGCFLNIEYTASISCDKGDGYVTINTAFDLNTGKRLTYKDLLIPGYLQDKAYKKFSKDILDDHLNITNTSKVNIEYITKSGGESDDDWYMPTAYATLDLSKYYDTAKWPAISQLVPCYDAGEPAPPVYPAEGVTEERWGYMTSANSKNGAQTVDIDYVDIYTGSEAIAKATEDGKTPDMNGTYVRNTNTKIRTFPLSYWCSFYITDAASQNGRYQKKITWAELLDYMNHQTGPILMHVYVYKGYITYMDQSLPAK